ncbi:MAG: hypothetical protein ACKN87_13955, partial [Microcystis aeruginosa]
PGYPLQGTSRGSSFCVTHQGREGDSPFSRANVEPWPEKKGTGSRLFLSLFLIFAGLIFSDYS